jgi:hypothetical protein
MQCFTRWLKRYKRDINSVIEIIANLGILILLYTTTYVIWSLRR